MIVEYGPGVGTITTEILRRMRPDAHLIAIETNETFVKFLKGSLQDPRLHVANESAADVAIILERLNLPQAQYVISGIPLGSMPLPLRADIVAKTRAALAPGRSVSGLPVYEPCPAGPAEHVWGCLAQHGEAQHPAGTPLCVQHRRRLRLKPPGAAPRSAADGPGSTPVRNLPRCASVQPAPVLTPRIRLRWRYRASGQSCRSPPPWCDQPG